MLASDVSDVIFKGKFPIVIWTRTGAASGFAYVRTYAPIGALLFTYPVVELTYPTPDKALADAQYKKSRVNVCALGVHILSERISII